MSVFRCFGTVLWLSHRFLKEKIAVEDLGVHFVVQKITKTVAHESAYLTTHTYVYIV
jgi:hypothetical protein